MDLTRYDPQTGKLNRTYRKWSSMLQRCSNPKHLAYSFYGAKGTQVCERWRKYDAFYEDMGPAPEGMWIDRIDTAKGYEPGNCRWVTTKESARNRKKRGLVPGTLADEARKLGVEYGIYYARLRSGWTKQEAIDTPKIAPGYKRERLTLSRYT